MRKCIFSYLVFLVLTSVSAISQSVNHWESVVYNNDIWRYWVGTSEPPVNWRSITFDENLWPEGRGGFGYGDNDDNTVIPKCFSVFIRIRFSIIDTSRIASAILNIDYDDGFVAYLNDNEIARSGINGIHPPYDQTASGHEANMYRGGNPDSFLMTGKKLSGLLLNGDNVLAIQVHNETAESSDLSSNAWFSLGIKDVSHYYREIPGWFIPVDPFTTSNLPIVVITTPANQIIPDEPKITAEMKIIHNGIGQINNVNDPGNIFSGEVGIEIRGRYSATLPQKPYGFETRDFNGNNLNVPILGMPEENDWVLTANYNDKVFLRNFLAFELFRKMGHYAPRTQYCEVVLNDEYEGIYLLGEKIKQDKNRVNVAKLNPDENTGEDITGGYIFLNDYYTSSDSWKSNFSPLNRPGTQVHFVYYYPEPDKITTEQKTFLKSYVDSFEGVLYGPYFKDHTKGYRAYLDVNSFVDYFIIGELSRNVDAYKKSRFFYKDKDSNGGLIHSGPPWDFDWAWKDITENCIHFNQTDGSGWAYRVNDCNNWPVPPSWEIRLLQDDDFANQVHDKYFLLRKTILSETYLNYVIDSVAILLDKAQERHYQRWKILGINVGTPEYGDQPETFAGEVTKFKNWITRRLTWLDANMVGEKSSPDGNSKILYRIYPNPVENIMNINSNLLITRVEIFNILGNLVYEQKYTSDYVLSVNTSLLGSGIYIIRIHFISGEVVTQRIVRK